MKIGLDFDGVISNCGKLKADYARQTYGVEIPATQFKKDLVIENRWLSADQYDEVSRVVYFTREVGLRLEPVDGLFPWLLKLLKKGHGISVITSRMETDLEIAKEWSARQGLPVEFMGVGYRNSKAERVLGLDVYVDDDLHKLKPLVGIVRHLFLFSWGYNERFDEAGIAKRVCSWKDLYGKICALEPACRLSTAAFSSQA